MPNRSILGGILLIIGTSIGGGMLALPMVTAEGGFPYSTLFLFGSWLVMMLASFLVLEVNLWLPENTNLVSMARATLGKFGQGLTWLTYLLLLYALLAAYIAGGSDILGSLAKSVGLQLPFWMKECLFVAILGTVVYIGIRSVDYVNRGLMSLKFLAYALLILLLFPHIHLPNLMHEDGKYLFTTVSIMITSYGYATVIPSLRTYYKSDVKKLRLMVFIGSLIPLFCYILWDLVVLGVLPLQGAQGLLKVMAAGNTNTALTASLHHYVGSSLIYSLWRGFTTVCVATSFLGVSLCLSDFLADGLRLPKRGRSKAFIFLTTFLPPLLIVFFFPGAFIRALNYAGILCAVLLILLPAVMAWRGRYQLKLAEGHYALWGGKPLLLALIIAAFGIMTLAFYLNGP